MPVSPETS